MPIPVDCPACSTRLRAPDGAAGMVLSCPRCNAPVPVPGGPAPVASAPAPASAPPPPRFPPAHGRPPAQPRPAPARPAAPPRPEPRPAARGGDPGGGGCLLVLAWIFALVALGGILWLMLAGAKPG